MRLPILVLNAGSSSIKFSVFETAADHTLAPRLHGQVEGIGDTPRLTVEDGTDGGATGAKLADQVLKGADHEQAIGAVLDWFAKHVGSEAGFDGVGHRVVHGGQKYARPTLIDAQVLDNLAQLVPLAPLHQPHQIAAIHAVSAVAPRVRQVACFDTSFHARQPPVAQQFGLPREFTARGIRRYGFHGLSYEYIVGVLPQVAPDCARGRLVVAHLGNGASMCAIHDGRSIASTMGLTPLDGLVMGTRSGALDPGVVLYLMQHERMSAPAIQELLYLRSGLLGVSGVSNDMRALLASEVPAAREAIDLFVYRIGRELGSLVAALGGLDALVFTGGIGEHAPQIRARVCQDAGWTGIRLDERANAAGGPRISSAPSASGASASGAAATGAAATGAAAPTAWVIPTDENLMVARHTRVALDG
jgi:acetate kinase